MSGESTLNPVHARLETHTFLLISLRKSALVVAGSLAAALALTRKARRI